MVSGFELKMTGMGPAVMGFWSMSTPMQALTTVIPGQESLLKAGLPLMMLAGAGRACSRSWTPFSPSALTAHLRATPLGWGSLAPSRRISVKNGRLLLVVLCELFGMSYRCNNYDVVKYM